MTIQEFRDYMASGKPIVGGGDVHMIGDKKYRDKRQINRILWKIAKYNF